MIKDWRDRKISIGSARLYLVITAVLYSTAGLAFKYVDWHPLVLSGMRSLVILPILGLYMGSFKIRFNRTVLLGAMFSYLSMITFVIANQLTTAANAIALQYTNPVFVVLYLWLFMKFKLQKRDMAVIAVTLLGMVLFFLEDMSPGNLLGNLVAILSGMAMAAMNIYSSTTKEETLHAIMAAQMISIAVGLLLLPVYPPHLVQSAIISVVYMSLFTTAVPYLFYAKGMKYSSPIDGSLILMVDPILNPVWVFAFTGEMPGPLAMVGAVLVIIGVSGWCVLNRLGQRGKSAVLAASPSDGTS